MDAQRSEEAQIEILRRIEERYTEILSWAYGKPVAARAVSDPNDPESVTVFFTPPVTLEYVSVSFEVK